MEEERVWEGRCEEKFDRCIELSYLTNGEEKEKIIYLDSLIMLRGLHTTQALCLYIIPLRYSERREGGDSQR